MTVREEGPPPSALPPPARRRLLPEAGGRAFLAENSPGPLSQTACCFADPCAVCTLRSSVKTSGKASYLTSASWQEPGCTSGPPAGVSAAVRPICAQLPSC